MIKTFVFGIVVGLLVTLGGLYVIPAVDITREASIVTVAPNGINMEAFHVNVPSDRIMIGAQGNREPLPQGMQWPDDALFADARAEVFKLRNSSDVVVGVATRFSIDDPAAGEILEWVLHLPARGSLYVTMSPSPLDGGGRTGKMRAGTREFESMAGEILESWHADTSRNNSADRGRIELAAQYVSTRPVRIKDQNGTEASIE